MDLPSGRLDLAHAHPFYLGRLHVEPSHRLVRNGDCSQVVEPRVMQLLVALHSANGGVLSRDDLMASCWGGVVVGDNAIQRAVSQARHIASTIGDCSFEIETVRGVGYRLVEPGSTGSAVGKPSAGLPEHGQPTLSRRASLAILGGGAAAIAAAAAVPLVPLARKGDAATERARELFARAEVAVRDEAYGSSEQAIALLKDAVAESPRYSRAWGALAVAYWESLYGTEADGADRIGSLALFAARRSLAIEPNVVTSQAVLMLLNSPFGDRRKLRDDLGKLARSDNNHWIVPRALAAAASDSGDWPSAITHYQQALEIQPLLPRVQVELARALWAAGRPMEADEALEKAGRLWPRNYGIWEFKFRYYALTGRHSEAASFVSDESLQPLGLGPLAIEKRLKLLDSLNGNSGRYFVIRTYLDEVKTSPINTTRATPILAMLGADVEIGDILQGYFFGRGPYGIRLSRFARRPTSFLYLPPVLRIHADPRVAHVINAIGLKAVV